MNTSVFIPDRGELVPTSAWWCEGLCNSWVLNYEHEQKQEKG